MVGSSLVVAAALIAVFYARSSSTLVSPAVPQRTADELFDDTRLHDLWIRISAADLHTLREHFEENDYYRVAIEWNGVTLSDVGVRSRGGATRNPSKPAYQLDFDRYVAGQRFLGLKGLVLDNLWHDASMVRDRASMGLYRRLGLAAPRQVHTRLFLGDQRTFAGVYAIVEDIDEVFVKRSFGEDEGYLYEYERVDGYHFEELGDDPALHAPRFEAQTHEDQPAEQIYGPIRDMVRVINRSPPSALAAALEPYLDLDRFLLFVAVQNYLAVWDGFVGDLGMANFSVYRFANSTRFEFIPWDQDNAFTSLDFAPWYNLERNALTKKIWEYRPLRERYLQQMLKVADAADGWLLEEIERQHQQVRAAAQLDTQRYQSYEEFEKSMAFVKSFARERPRWMRDAVAQSAKR